MMIWIWLIFLVLLLSGSLYFPAVRNWWKSFPKKIGEAMKKNWADELGPKGEVVRRGRKHGFPKRVAMLSAALVLVFAFKWTTEAFAESWIFRLGLSGFIAWLAVSSVKRLQIKVAVAVVSAGTLAILSVLYLPSFREVFGSAIWWLIGLAFLVFVTEELLNINWYPKSVGLVGAGVVVVIFIAAIFSAVRPHEYYAIEGSRANLSVAEMQQEAVAWEKLKTRVKPDKSIAGFKKIPPSLSGISSDSIPEVATDWLGLSVKNHLPTEYGRVEAVAGKLFFIVYFTIAGLVFMLVAIPEIIGDSVKAYKSRPKGKKEEGGGGELKTIHYFIFEVVGRVIDDLFRFRASKTGAGGKI